MNQWPIAPTEGNEQTQKVFGAFCGARQRPARATSTAAGPRAPRASLLPQCPERPEPPPAAHSSRYLRNSPDTGRSPSNRGSPRMTRNPRQREPSWEPFIGDAWTAGSSPSSAAATAGDAATEAARCEVALRNCRSFPAALPANAAIVPERYNPDSNTPL